MDATAIRHPLEHREVTEKILAAAIEVHRALGPGLLESAYQACLEFELRESGLLVRREEPIPLVYKSLVLPGAYRADLIVESKVLVEVKAVDRLLPIHDAQTLTYLKLRHLNVGLLLNFSCPTLREGIRRLVR
jgi:GxxExxY protein